MFGINGLYQVRKLLVSLLLAVILGLGLGGCSNDPRTIDLSKSSEDGPTRLAGRIAEVSPPEVLQELRQQLERYQPQVKILSPRPDQVLQDDRVSVRLQVQDLPTFQNEEFGLGPHLHVILDNQPYRAVYDTRQPLVLEDLSPGTHTLRVFASRPWHESFKNEGAYAQTTFHLFTRTPENNPDPSQPLLTYSRPKGSYGAEPVMLDFYLTNTPLHLIAQENPEDEILDWRIRCTINGESFIFDRWQPIYLKGLKPGKNWVQLELLDEKGDPFPNPFNNTVRLITYEPKGQDTLSKLVRGELSADTVRGIVDPNYVPGTPVLEPTPEPAPVPTPVEPIPEPTISPKAEEVPEAGEIPSIKEPKVEPAPEVEEIPQTQEIPGAKAEQPTEAKPTVERGFEDLETPVSPEVEPEVEETPVPEPSEPPRSQPTSPKGFFDRFRRRFSEPAPVPVAPSPVPEVLEEPDAADIVPEAAEELPQPEEPVEEPALTVEPLPEATPENRPEAIAPPPAEPSQPETDQSETDQSESVQPETTQPKSAQPGRFFDRFRRRSGISPTPLKPEDTLPEIIETPEPKTFEPEMSEPDLTEIIQPESPVEEQTTSAD